ncbi:MULTISPECIES: aminoacyl-tRNA hydrolase [unclassified Clostridium]|uniref:aminoacyl-tRNA hydrolase n=1 Tax=unclassified Clostridium TaxID=2614128 RepID=UPI00052CE520|nr:MULTISPECIES: aminoacyl-tRNA hydrolase [unclassified Clostridium]KGK89246.1 peptidyl-tRNA hydrolase [Clostridium sp. HMP27]
MYLIVGLGNPGREYEHTRHNVGFDSIDKISSRYNIDLNRTKFKGMYGEGFINGEKVILLKPLTYMNLSGESVGEIANFYKIKSENIIVIYDDVDLEVGRIRIRKKGSSGGHNGIKSILYHLVNEDFTRIKLGVGKAERDMISHVLGKFNVEDREKVEGVLNCTLDIVDTIIKEGADSAMNKYNNFKA